MASVLDSAILLGKETTYGTVVTTSRGYEGKADTSKRAVEQLDSVGFRAGRQAKSSDRRVTINMGGTGSLEFDVLNKSFGFLLQAMLGSISGPTQVAATTAYLSTAATTAADPDDSYTMQVHRVDVGGTNRVYTYSGSVVTGWSLTNSPGEYLTANLDFDYNNEVNNIAADTATYPSSATPFDWTMATIEVNSVATAMRSFNLEANLGLNVERRRLRGNALKLKPIRSSVPEFTGSFEVDFEDNTLNDLFVAGTIVPITATWTGAEIEAGQNFELIVTMPSCQLLGETPESQIDDLPMQNVPFEVLHGASDAITITYKSTDTAL